MTPERRELTLTGSDGGAVITAREDCINTKARYVIPTGEKPEKEHNATKLRLGLGLGVASKVLVLGIREC